MDQFELTSLDQRRLGALIENLNERAQLLSVQIGDVFVL